MLSLVYTRITLIYQPKVLKNKQQENPAFPRALWVSMVICFSDSYYFAMQWIYSTHNGTRVAFFLF